MCVVAKSKPAKPKKDAALLQRVHANLGTLLDRTLQDLVDAKAPIPAALASAAGAFLKLHAVESDLEQDATDEAQAAAAFDFVPRVSASPAEDFTPGAVDDFADIDADDHENRAKRARYLASKLDEANPERDRLLLVAKEAEAKSRQQ